MTKFPAQTHSAGPSLFPLTRSALVRTQTTSFWGVISTVGFWSDGWDHPMMFGINMSERSPPTPSIVSLTSRSHLRDEVTGSALSRRRKSPYGGVRAPNTPKISPYTPLLLPFLYPSSISFESQPISSNLRSKIRSKTLTHPISPKFTPYLPLTSLITNISLISVK